MLPSAKLYELSAGFSVYVLSLPASQEFKGTLDIDYIPYYMSICCDSHSDHNYNRQSWRSVLFRLSVCWSCSQRHNVSVTS